jgi:hypothetical protein
MAYSATAAPLLLWLTPALLALLLYGLGQGFVKMWITEVRNVSMSLRHLVS